MQNNEYYFTSESVSSGHPDKIADQISDAILDALLAKDKNARVACEVMVKTGLVLVAGEISTNAWVDAEAIARDTIREIGYNIPELGFDADSCAVLCSIGKQSADIARGVDQDDNNLGAGDQGLMFGYACRETEVLMPAPITYSHRLMQQHAKVRTSSIDWLRPDAKTQLTYVYENDIPVAIDTVVLSTQHAASIDNKTIYDAVVNEIIKPVLPADMLSDKTKILINPTGRFVIGGPVGDCGLTGRKIIVDTYGGSARHGGGCFSGKDPSKVDRSGAYAARYVAKNIVAAGLADKCEVQISYAIGVADPTSIMVETFGTNKIDNSKIVSLVHDNFDLRPRAIINDLDLLQPIYKQTAAYGHFGRDDLNLPWEKTDKAAALKQAAKLTNGEHA